MRQSSVKKNETLDELIKRLQSRIAALEKQHITFVSFTSSLINSHCKSVLKDLSAITSSKVLRHCILKSTKALEDNYEKAASSLNLTTSSTSIQKAIDYTKQKLLDITQQKLSESELEMRISYSFIALSEVIHRNLQQPDSFRESLPQSPSPVRRDSIGTLEGKNSQSSDVFKADMASDKESSALIQSRSFYKGTPENKVKVGSKDSSKFSSILASPISSPIIGEYYRKPRPKLTSSVDSGFNIDKLKEKLEVLTYLLEKFSNFTSQLEEAINNNPELECTLSNFKSAKKELAYALQDIIGPQAGRKKNIRDCGSNEAELLKNENCKLKAEINERNEDYREAIERVNRQEEEFKEAKKSALIVQQELLQCEKEKEESRLESVFLKGKIERLQKNNKVMQESLTAQEFKLRDLALLQSKYEQIIFANKSNTKNVASICYESILTITPTPISPTKRSRSQNPSTPPVPSRPEVEKAKENYSLNKALSELIAEKNRMTEELLINSENTRRIQEENKDLRAKNVETLSMCKALEDLLNNKTQIVPILSTQHLPGIICASTMLDFSSNYIEAYCVKCADQEAKASSASEALSQCSQELKITQRLNKSLQDSLSDYIKKELSTTAAQSMLAEANMKLKSDLLSCQSQNALLSHQLSTKHLELTKLSSQINSTEPKPSLSSQLLESFSSLPALSPVIEQKLLAQLSRLISLQASLSELLVTQQYKKASQAKEKQFLAAEIKRVDAERQRLLETRDRLIIQCNKQSEELLTLRLEQEEKISLRAEETEDRLEKLEEKVRHYQSTEATLQRIIRESDEKCRSLEEVIREKCKKLEEMQEDLMQLKFKSSVVTNNSGDRYKEEVYSLKMKNIKLEQTLEEAKNSGLNSEEMVKIKNSFTSQLAQVSEEKTQLERRIKENDLNFVKEKEALQRSLDSFAKQLTGSYLEINNLKLKVKELQMKLKPEFSSPEDYEVIRAVEHEALTWFLVFIISDREYIWLDKLPFDPMDEIKDPMPILLKERATLQKLNSDLCIDTHKLKALVASIETLSRKEGSLHILALISESQDSDLPKMRQNTRNIDAKRQSIQGFNKKPKNGRSKIFSFNSDNLQRKALSELDDDDAEIKGGEVGILQQMIATKEEEICKKTELIKKQEHSIAYMKDQNVKLLRSLERFEHVKVLIAKLRLLAPNFSKECSAIMQKILMVSEINLQP